MKYDLNFYNERIAEADRINDAINAEYVKDLPNQDDMKLDLGYQTYRIPFLDAKYKRRRSYVQNEVIKAKRFHEKISLLVKDYYSSNSNRHDIEDYEQYGWVGLFKINITPPERQAWIEADAVYQAVTTWLGKQLNNLDLIDHNIKNLPERGRQFKTTLEFIKFNNGEV